MTSALPFYRKLVVLNGAVPLVMLVWDALDGQLAANSVNHALHITGIVSLVCLLLTLAMTPLQRITGWGGWGSFRRSLGLYGFFYAVVHLGIYVVLDRAGDLRSTLHEVVTRTYLQIGTVALLLMIPLAVTSTNAMIHRLGSRRWKQLHRATYVVGILGVVHYYLLVKSDVRQPVAFGVVLGVLLLFRLLPQRRVAAVRVATTSPTTKPGQVAVGTVAAGSPGLRPIDAIRARAAAAKRSGAEGTAVANPSSDTPQPPTN